MSLLKKGVVSSVSVPVDKGRIKGLYLTRKGRKVLGCNMPRPTRHGGMQHQYWKEKLAERLRECDYTVEEEHPIGGGRTVDLLASKDGRRIAFEVETGKSNVLANVEKVIGAGLHRLVVVATSAKVKRELVARLTGRPGVEVLTGGEAMRRREWV